MKCLILNQFFALALIIMALVATGTVRAEKLAEAAPSGSQEDIPQGFELVEEERKGGSTFIRLRISDSSLKKNRPASNGRMPASVSPDSEKSDSKKSSQKTNNNKTKREKRAGH